MSSSSSSSSSSFGVFADSTECSICLEVLTKPVSLPCRHVFCLTCLQKYAVHSNKRPGDCLSCPICRRELVIPNRNFSAFIVTAEDNCRTDDGRHAVISRHSSSPSNRTGAAASQHQWQNNGETSGGGGGGGGVRLMTCRLLPAAAVVVFAVGLGILIISKGFRR